jgi:hypothetical protein
MYTPSASRFFDWYVVGGCRRQFESITDTEEVVTPDGPEDITFVRHPRWDIYSELGVRIRAEVPGKLRPFVLGYHFGGFRLGIQALGTSGLEDLRFVFEVGAGAW